MALGDAYQDSTNTALGLMVAQPLQPDTPKSKHSAWSVVPRAMVAGVAEAGASAIDIAGAFGQVVAATGANANPLLPDTPDIRKERLDAYEKLKSEGIDWRTAASKPAYDFAHDMRPDPITAGFAEQMIFGLGKGLTKAIGAMVTLGPVPGAVAFGTSEGMTAAEDLARQGVEDKATRMKVGAVTGVTTGTGALIPASMGATRAASAAIGAAVNPALGVVQRATSQEILKNANYEELAKQFDPLDPAMLAVEAVFGAVMGGIFHPARPGAAKPADKAEPTMQPTHEQIDAAMVHNLTMARDAHEAITVKSLPPDVERAALKKASDVQNEKNAFDIAEEIRSLEEGGGVNLSKLAENPKFWDSENEQWTPEGLAAADSATRAQAIENLRLRDIAELSDLELANHKAKYAAMLEILDGLKIPYTDTSSAQSKYIEVGGYKLRFADHANQVRDSAVRGSLPVLNVAPGENTFANALRVVMESTPTANKPELSQGLPRDGMQERAVRADKSGSPEPAQSDGAVGGDAKTTREPKKQQDPHIASILDRAEALRVEQPDLPIAVLDDGTHVRFADELDAIRREAREGIGTDLGANDAPLLKVAADCLLSMAAP